MMKKLCGMAASALILASGSVGAVESKFGRAEDSLRAFKAVRYENTYTNIPSSGKLVAIKITDSGRAYYVCKERGGYVIYHLEIRPVKASKEKLEKELKKLGGKWDGMQPDELLFTKTRYDSELQKRLSSYNEAVWVRNEIGLGGSSAQKSSRSRRRK